MTEVPFSELVGKTINRIDGLESESEVVTIHCTDETKYQMYHTQDCCESVTLNDIVGDPADLLSNPVLIAYVETKTGDTDHYDSETWTFYRLSTIKGTVTLKWYGTSNGYYSESVEFDRL